MGVSEKAGGLAISRRGGRMGMAGFSALSRPAKPARALHHEAQPYKHVCVCLMAATATISMSMAQRRKICAASAVACRTAAPPGMALGYAVAVHTAPTAAPTSAVKSDIHILRARFISVPFSLFEVFRRWR